MEVAFVQRAPTVTGDPDLDAEPRFHRVNHVDKYWTEDNWEPVVPLGTRLPPGQPVRIDGRTHLDGEHEPVEE